MPPNNTATPAAFTLQLRLVDDHLRPWKDTSYEVTWGNTKRTGTTDAGGFLRVTVDRSVTRGYCDLGEMKGSTFVAKIRVPLEVHQGETFKPAEEDVGGGNAALYSSWDIAWRLVNLGFLPFIPRGVVSYGLPAPSDPKTNVPKETEEAVRRFKATYFLGYPRLAPDYLNKPVSAVQDDDFLNRLVEIHDYLLAPGEAAAKVAAAKAKPTWVPL